MKIHKSLLSAALFTVVSGLASAQTTYNVATSFANNSLWTNTATWNPNTGTPGALDSIDVTSGTTVINGNAISLGSTSQQITNFTYSQTTNSIQLVGTAANVNLQVDGTFTKNNASVLNIGTLRLTGAGGISLNAGTLAFVSAASGTGTNQNAVDIAKNWTIGGAAAGDTPTINFRTTRSAGNGNYSGTLSGAINFATTTPNRVLTINSQNTATSNSNIDITGNLTGAIGAKEVTFSISGQGANANSSVVTIGGAGTSSYTASAGSKFVVGRLAATANNINLDLVNGRVNAFGGVETIQLGDANVSPGASNTANVRVLSSVADTIEQKINVNGYTTALSQAFTIGGTHTSGTVEYSGLVTLSKPTTLLANTSGAKTIFTGGISAGSNAVTVSGAGTLLINSTTTGSGAWTVNVGSTLGGSGTIAGAATINGTLAPGNSPGTMTYNDTLTLAGNTIMEIDGGSGAGLIGGHDFVNLTGVGAQGILTTGGTLTLDIGTTFGAGTYSWNLFDFASETGTFSSVSLADQYAGSLTNTSGVWDLTSGSNTWQFTEATGVLGLTVAIPEPSTYAMVGVGLLALWTLRRRTQKSA